MQAGVNTEKTGCSGAELPGWQRQGHQAVREGGTITHREHGRAAHGETLGSLRCRQDGELTATADSDSALGVP